MRSGRSVIRSGAMRSPLAVTEVNNFYHMFGRSCELVFKPCDLDFAVGILLDLQLLFAVKKVADFATVNLEEAHKELRSCGREFE